MSAKIRRQYSGAEKVAILKRHLVNGESISNICDEVKLNPNVFYRWQKTFFENGAKAFESSKARTAAGGGTQIAQLKQKLVDKDGVISELVTELIKSKKNGGMY